MHRSLSSDLQANEESFKKLLRNTWIAGLVAWILMRSSYELLDKLALGGLGLNINVGHIILASPIALLVATIVLRDRAQRVNVLRQALSAPAHLDALHASERAAWEVNDRFQRPLARSGGGTAAGRALAILGLAPLQFFLTREYFTFTNPAWFEKGQKICPKELTLLAKHLFTAHEGHQPRRCFQLDVSPQENFPWIYPPLMGWFYIGLLLLTTYLVFKVFQTRQSRQLLRHHGSQVAGEEKTDPTDIRATVPEDETRCSSDSADS